MNGQLVGPDGRTVTSRELAVCPRCEAHADTFTIRDRAFRPWRTDMAGGNRSAAAKKGWITRRGGGGKMVSKGTDRTPSWLKAAFPEGFKWPTKNVSQSEFLRRFKSVR